jgi:hypothetical protein
MLRWYRRKKFKEKLKERGGERESERVRACVLACVHICRQKYICVCVVCLSLSISERYLPANMHASKYLSQMPANMHAACIFACQNLVRAYLRANISLK